MSIEKIFTPQDDAFYSVITHAAGPQGALPLTPQMLMEWGGMPINSPAKRC